MLIEKKKNVHIHERLIVLVLSFARSLMYSFRLYNRFLIFRFLMKLWSTDASGGGWIPWRGRFIISRIFLPRATRLERDSSPVLMTLRKRYNFAIVSRNVVRNLVEKSNECHRIFTFVFLNILELNAYGFGYWYLSFECR